MEHISIMLQAFYKLRMHKASAYNLPDLVEKTKTKSSLLKLGKRKVGLEMQ